MASRHTVPPYTELLWPTLQAVEAAGGSASIDEIVDAVITSGSFTNEQQSVLHGDGPQTEIEYRLAWARTYLKGMDLLTNSRRGIWSVTEPGARLLDDARSHDKRWVQKQIAQLHEAFVADYRRKRKERLAAGEELAAAADTDTTARDWKDELLDHLMEMSPGSFERLAQRLLREAGFISATVTGRSGDGGIDGLGVYRLSLVSFPVFYQCKRYRGSVGAGAVRDFRGAMAGRGDKGLLITTGSFTADAKTEATRDGAPPVDLIDGGRLCDLLREYELGVRTTVRQVEDIAVDRYFFEDI
jgi:restriction system protein